MDTKTVSIKKEFTEEELNDIAVQISEKIQAYYVIEEDKRKATSCFNTDLKVIKTDIQKLVKDINLGYCWEERTCDISDDWDNNTRSYLDVVTGEVVKREPLNGESSLFADLKDSVSKVTVTENDGPEKVIYQEKEAVGLLL